jgi:hypothetical protein
MARLTKAYRSVVLAALRRCCIPENSRNRIHPGQLPCGYDYQNYRLVKNQAEQGVIRLMRQGRACGLSPRQIAGQNNQRPVLRYCRPSKAGRGTWVDVRTISFESLTLSETILDARHWRRTIRERRR